MGFAAPLGRTRSTLCSFCAPLNLTFSASTQPSETLFSGVQETVSVPMVLDHLRELLMPYIASWERQR